MRCRGCRFEIKKGKDNFVTAAFADDMELSYHLECTPIQFKVVKKK